MDQKRGGGHGGEIGSGVALLVRTGILGEREWGIILSEEVAVRSAPSSEDDLTRFRIDEGTKVRLDQRIQGWAEIVLDGGPVGQVSASDLA